MLARVKVKLVLLEIAEIVQGVVIAGATQVGDEGRFDAKLIGCSIMRDADLTADVLTVYVVVVVGTTNAPAAAEPQAAGDTEFTAQLVAVT